MPKISIKKELERMEVGGEVSFPAEKYRVVAVTCSDYGFVSGRRYRVRKDWVKREVIVRREK